MTHIQPLAYQSHEAPCYNPSTKQLYFIEWGPTGTDGNNGMHNWQYLLDVDSNTLRKITTSPPTVNAHGCVEYEGHLYVVTDGTRDSESGQLVKVDPTTLKMIPVLNNMLGQPFAGFNDLGIDREGNFWLKDSKSGWVCLLSFSLFPFIFVMSANNLEYRAAASLTSHLRKTPRYILSMELPYYPSLSGQLPGMRMA